MRFFKLIKVHLLVSELYILLQNIYILMWRTEIGFMMDLCYIMQKYVYCGTANDTARS